MHARIIIIIKRREKTSSLSFIMRRRLLFPRLFALGMLLLLFVVVVVVVVVVVLCSDVVHALNTDGGGDASSFTIGFPSISASEHDANARLLRTKLTNPPRGTLNIALITCEFDGPTNNGGIGTQFTALAKLYAKNGHFVTVVFTEGERYEQQQHSGVPHTHVSSIVTSRERRFCKKPPPPPYPGFARSDRCYSFLFLLLHLLLLFNIGVKTNRSRTGSNTTETNTTLNSSDCIDRTKITSDDTY